MNIVADSENKLDFAKTTITIGAESVEAYEIAPDNKDFYIIRAMNWNGEINYYTYDTVENTMQRYVASKLPAGEVGPSATEAPVATPGQTDETNVEIKPGTQKMLIILVAAACAVCIILAAFLIYFALKERKTCKIMTSPDDDTVD